MRYAVVIENAGSNFSAYVPDLPGSVATSPNRMFGYSLGWTTNMWTSSLSSGRRQKNSNCRAQPQPTFGQSS